MAPLPLSDPGHHRRTIGATGRKKDHYATGDSVQNDNPTCQKLDGPLAMAVRFAAHSARARLLFACADGSRRKASTGRRLFRQKARVAAEGMQGLWTVWDSRRTRTAAIRYHHG